ncbi:nucleoside-diphosphate sugar epimerase/dehydratase [Pseudochelatococcus contaminans]|uniref:O-antigen biosynthesis protein WbqV n=1 Tax=Pseudochelatococcus contaminans TaxID=1538103 RepID=A0A7W5Z4Y8_9HYPH|nr:nucleoside-diphosphate sugar epimerase/dehydratase [Pseudochelatococcus contaminans]MBB3809792.1 O-antigen biosynthesis protein WbqV [Pseudochelatococcus contaminans]
MTRAAIRSSTGFKKLLIVAHDLMMTGLAVVLAFVMRFDGVRLETRLDALPVILPGFIIYAGIVYWIFSLYKSRWRFASLPDLANILRAVTVLALTLLVVDYVLASSTFYGFFFFGKITIILYWMLQLFLLGGPRLAYRYLKYAQSRQTLVREGAVPALILGRGSDAEVLLRAIESGALRKIAAKGILTPRTTDLGQSIRGVPVVGEFSDLEQAVADFAERGHNIRRLVLAPSALGQEAESEHILARARKLGLPLSRLQGLDTGKGELGGGIASLAPVEIEDLLLRPTVEIDHERLARFVNGKRIAVTGGGGSIGSEICMRAAAFGAADILVIENSEPALHQITEELRALDDGPHVQGAIADVRDRERLHQVLAEFKPDLVFHAAALKHVPYLEQDWAEGVRTNVFGSVNAADASLAAGASAFVMISTDKAIEPVSMLGVTKRFAEMYAQALDAETLALPEAPRLIAVRFGNVLGSNGSVVPKFKAQIARGGPVTVTHRDMVRYFMTVREACNLVLTAVSHADGDMRAAAAASVASKPSVYVLKMGQPVRIYDMAERMIRLAGFEPGAEIEIAVTGIRPGERLHEILFGHDEAITETGIDGVMAARAVFPDRHQLAAWLAGLEDAVNRHDRGAAEAVLGAAIPDYARRQPAAAPTTPAPAGTIQPE